MELSVWSVVFVCIMVVVLVYIKNAFAFVRERKFLRLTFLSILVLLLCSLFVIMCHDFANKTCVLICAWLGIGV